MTANIITSTIIAGIFTWLVNIELDTLGWVLPFSLWWIFIPVALIMLGILSINSSSKSKQKSTERTE